MTNKVLFLFGTRPEAIKLAPVIIEFLEHSEFEVRVGVTAQHREILDTVLHFFNIVPHYDLNIMTHEQDLASLSSKLIKKITEEILAKENFDLVVVQGDQCFSRSNGCILPKNKSNSHRSRIEKRQYECSFSRRNEPCFNIQNR